MNRILADFVAGKNKSSAGDYSSISNSSSGFPCTEISYSDWKSLKRPDSHKLWLVKDHPSAEDIKNGNIMNNGLLPPAGKVFKGRVECMKRQPQEELVDILLRHGWNGSTDIYTGGHHHDKDTDHDNDNNGNNNDKPSDDGDNNTPGVIIGDLVVYHDTVLDFPVVGESNKFYYDKTKKNLYHYNTDLKEYVNIAGFYGGSSGEDNDESSLVHRYDTVDDFPPVGLANKLYYDKSDTTLYQWHSGLEKYLPLAELLENVIINGNDDEMDGFIDGGDIEKPEPEPTEIVLHFDPEKKTMYYYDLENEQKHYVNMEDLLDFVVIGGDDPE